MTIKGIMRGLKEICEEREDYDDLQNIVIEKLMKNDKEINRKDLIGFLDGANIIMFIAKRMGLRKLIENRFDVSAKKRRAGDLLNKLKYIPKNLSDEIMCFYSGDYLNIILNLTKGYDNVKIKIKKNFPIWVETKDFIVVLASRDENSVLEGNVLQSKGFDTCGCKWTENNDKNGEI